MVILEGPDGSGKSSLIRRLSDDMDIPIHERASHSTRGPIDDLFEWAKKDVLTWHEQPFALYDRHPFVSEFVYGPICRGFMDARFHTPEARQLVKEFSYNSIVIFCDPGTYEIQNNVHRDPHMAGVDRNINQITFMYRSLFTVWPTPLRVMRWDYTTPVPDRVLDSIHNMITAQQAAHERYSLNHV